MVFLDNPFDIFDAIYCINQDSAQDRWNDVQKEFDKFWITSRIKRFSAFSVPGRWDIWCLMSHRAIMKEAYLNNYTNVLIFEDDVVFAEGADNVIFSAINQLKQLPNWDIFYMGCSWFLEDYPALFYSGDLIKICGCRANHATAYTRPVLAKILDILPENQIDVEKFLSIHEAFDLYSPRFLQPFVRVYGMPTPICFQRAGWSDIKKSQKDYSKVMKDNFYILQKRTKIEHLWNYSYHILRLPYLYIKIHVKYFLGSLKK